METATKTEIENTITDRQVLAFQRLTHLSLIIPGDKDLWLFDDPNFIRDGHQERVLYLHAKGVLLEIDPMDLQHDLSRIDPQYQLPKPWRYQDLDQWRNNFFEVLKGRPVQW